MLQLLLTLFVIALVFALLVVFGGRFVVSRVGKAVSKRHGETEWVLGTATAPPAWYRGQSALLHIFGRLGLGSRGLERIRAFFKRRLEYRLLGLLRYIEASNVISDESIRTSMAGTLRQIGRQWEASTWEQVTGQSGAGTSDTARTDDDTGNSSPGTTLE